ncbi:FHA domain-containing protein [Streptomyces sp. NPDC052236]|uniref:FHA domain-containing protein n=1 Tax=Streptomyces sp. NPDC052236 TaxID=3365686 RepID=UPI0037D15D26
MQIRLTVLAPRGGQSAASSVASGHSSHSSAHASAGRACDVLITAPAGTALAAVASGLATAVSGPDASGAVVLYAGRERLDAQSRTLGEPPLVDGAVLSLQVPSADESPRSDACAQLQVVAGPDAGGVHLLQGGRITIGRSADADVPLDDPDVSRLHCAVTVGDDGAVTVEDLGSTNGTTLDGTVVRARQMNLPAGALLRLGESTLRVAPGENPPALATAPDGEGHLRVTRPADSASQEPGGAAPGAHGPGSVSEPGGTRSRLSSPGGAGPGGYDTDGFGSGAYGPDRSRSDGYGGGGSAAADESAHGPYGPASGPGSHGSGRYGSAGAPAPDPGAAHADRTAHGTYGPTDRSGTADRSGSHSSRPSGSATGGHGLMGGGHGEEESDPGGYGSAGAPAPGAVRRGSGSGISGPGGYGSAGRPRPGGSGPGANETDGSGPDPYGPGLSAAGGDASAHGAYSQGRGADSQAEKPRPGGSGTGTGSAPDGATSHAYGPADGIHPRVPSQYVPTAPTHAGLGDAATLNTYGTPARGTQLPSSVTRRRGIGAWARRLAGVREEQVAEVAPRPGPQVAAAPLVDSWPDPAAVLLTALGPGPRLWERGPRHPESLVLRLGTADRAELPSVPVTVGLREAGSLGLAGPSPRLAGLARSAVAQLAALHSPVDLEFVLISTDRSRSLEERISEWAWLGWLPHLRPAHGQDCRLLVAYDRDQATARTAELTRRLDDGPLGPSWPSADRRAVAEAAAAYEGARTVVIVDGDPGSAALREATARLAGVGAAAGIHLICLAETQAASPLSPVAATYESACAASLAFRECGAVALLSGDVATALRLLRTAGGQPAGHGTVAAVDAVSAAWAERFGRALAPLRAEGTGAHHGRAVALPRSARLLDELGLARATPASLMARWASASDGTLVLGAGPRGSLAVDLTEEGPHLLIEGPVGSGRTELLRAVAASLAAAGRPDRLGLLLVDGAGGERGEGLAACTELPHVTEHLVASDPVRMRAFAQALGAELKRRSELLGSVGFAEWHTQREVADRMVGQRAPGAAPESGRHPSGAAEQRGDLDSASSGTLRLRAGGRTKVQGPAPLPRLVVLVDDFDALVAPALGSPGRPAAGSVVRALEAVARDGDRLGVHLVATSARPDRTADTELAHGARLRVVLDVPPASPGPDDPAPGRGRLGHPDGRVTPFQSGRVTGRIPRTATSRPTVVVLEWDRMGDPPTRRPVRELGNGPTDLALLASALERAARSVDAAPVPPLTPAHP